MREASAASSLLMHLPTAVCKLIYTFCKIRGEKVIVRFLNVETKYLELLLSALEDAERQQASDEAAVQWTWEERYVVLLWLSHLMFAPFDLSTISSVYMEDVDLAGVQGFFWPSNVPGITVRILPLAVKYLACPGKERDAAKALLVRMAMRRDMQQLGVLHALVQWALFWLRPREDEPPQSPYKYIGVLAFLAGILASSTETSDMDKYSTTIFYTVNAIPSNDDQMSRIVKSSALAKKTIIKAMRSIAVSKLKGKKRGTPGIELVETTVGHLLENLADNDTPVRFAASKALSIITLSLPGYMASEIVEAVLESLNRNVLLINNPTDPSIPPTRDLTSVDPLEWHGLMLTLSHLLYRRSPPADNLGAIIRALLLGLAFERRSPSGGSIGTNVRDAACFGIWALARRYSTHELLAVPPDTVRDPGSQGLETSVLQILATDLVVTASLDPAGNIRRGSSAALQELIGRHPDTIEQGIAIVQAVDYHTVALRSRAVHNVAVSATRLHAQYGEAILAALLGWRGGGDADAAARRVAGLSYGTVTSELANLKSSINFDELILASMSRVLRLWKVLQARQVEERHGFLLALASIFDQIPLLIARGRKTRLISPVVLGHLVEVGEDALLEILQSVKSTVFRKQELIAEAACRLIVSFFPILQAEAIGFGDAIEEGLLLSGPDLMSASDITKFTNVVSRLKTSTIENQDRLSAILKVSRELVNTWLTRTEPEVISAASEASVIVLIFSSPRQRHEIIQGWASTVRNRSRSNTGAGHFCALTRAYRVVGTSKSKDGADTICGTLLDRWAQDKETEVRVAILQSLVQSELLRENMGQLIGMVTEGLEDYKTNARGDVGSHVRLQAIKATKYLWTTLQLAGSKDANSLQAASRLLQPILRLAAEKLDRVRVEAQATLALALRPEQVTCPTPTPPRNTYTLRRPSSQFRKLTFSSQSYFQLLLNLLNADWLQEPFDREAGANDHSWMDELLAGYVTSADTGNEDLVIASRAALISHCDAGQANLDRVCGSLLRNLKARQGQDRVVVPTLEIIAFLFSAGVYQRATGVDVKSLCLQVQKAGYKSGNVRKLEACVKVYGGVAGMGVGGGGGGGAELAPMATEMLGQKRVEAIAEAGRRLGALMAHPWPRVRSSVVDELWGLASAGGEADDKSAMLKGVDWSVAEKGSVKRLVAELGLQ